jgi:hypothetical protein
VSDLTSPTFELNKSHPHIPLAGDFWYSALTMGEYYSVPRKADRNYGGEEMETVAVEDRIIEVQVLAMA